MVVNNKTAKTAIVGILVIGLGVVGVLGVLGYRGRSALTNEECNMLLTEEQYELIKGSISQELLEEMGSIECKNAWVILDAMREVGFIENTYPGESGVGLAVWIIGMLHIGEFKEMTPVRIEGTDFASSLVLRAVNQAGNTYYIRHHRTWGLALVARDTEDGEVVYCSVTHAIIDGKICVREYPRGPAICEE